MSGLSGTVVLQDNGGDDLSVTRQRPVHVRDRAGQRGGLRVTVKTNPSGQTCTVSNGSGTVGSANVTNVAVSCAQRRRRITVGGTVSGLSGTVVLQDNGGDDLSVTRERAVHVRDRAGQRGGLQRDGEDEPVRADLHGLQRVGHGRLGQRHQRRGHLHRRCRRITVGGTVSGLSGTVVLQDNGGDDLSVTRERVVHVRDRAGQRGGLQRDGEDQPVRADLHGVERVGHDRLGQRHQRRGHLHDQHGARRRRMTSTGLTGRWGRTGRPSRTAAMAISSQEVIGTAGGDYR